MQQFYPPGLLYNTSPHGPVSLMWLDFETTGLDTLKKHITEVTVQFSTERAKTIPDMGFTASLALPENLLQDADDWVKTNMKEVLNNCRFEPNRLRDYLELDHILARWLTYFGSTPEKPTIHLAGNSVWYDRVFIARLLPETFKRLHYRQVDVSSVRLFLESAAPLLQDQFAFTKRELHRTAADVQDSLQQYSLYRAFVRRLAEQAGENLASPNDIRAKGWCVSAHNDYRLNGEAHTYWSFTKAPHYEVHGEGKSDADALNIVRQKIAALEALIAP